MKKLGPVGGTGPESTDKYYRNVVHGVGEIFGRERPPKIAIGSLSAFEVSSFCTTHRFDELADYLFASARNGVPGTRKADL